MEAESRMRFPLVKRSRYDEAIKSAAVWRDKYVAATARTQPVTATVSDAQVESVVLAIQDAAERIVNAVKGIPA